MMENGETIPEVKEGETAPQVPSAPKREPLIALVALVVVLAVVLGGGYFAYNALTADRGQSTSEAPAATETEWAKPSGTGPMLADYDATVYTEDGEPFTLTQIADGKPLVINFWATWCPYCIREMPDYLEIHRDYKDRVSFAFVDFPDGTRETVGKAALWLQENSFDELPAYYDTQHEAQYIYGVNSLPTTVVVSASGEVMTVSPGAIDPDVLRSALDSLL